MPQKELPNKYYLNHFLEFVDFIKGPSKHLLDPNGEKLLETLLTQAEDTLCTFVRAANRKYPVIRSTTLVYEEIEAPETQLNLLLEANIFRRLEAVDLELWFTLLTKPELLTLLRDSGKSCQASMPKAQLSGIALDTLTFSDISKHRLYFEYIVRNTDDVLDYWLFLFFGDIRSRLNKFSMRDLGVMSTRQGDGSQTARFDALSDAQSAYYYVKIRQAVNDFTDAQLIDAAKTLNTLPEASTPVAKDSRDRYLFKLGKRLLDVDADAAMACWAMSDHQEATEKWVRFQYQQGELEAVKQKLESIIINPDSEHTLLFAEDFLARKFDSKKTSILTDMLRQSGDPILVDEMYRDSVEQGVVRHYHTLGHFALHTENGLWQTLFGLTFWAQLFEQDEHALRNEFDIRPRLLTEKRFYSTLQDEIHQRLSGIAEPGDFIRQLTQTAASHYGKPNGIFLWHPGALEVLAQFIEASKIDAIKAQLLAMSQRYHELNDGYPDLMIIDQQGARFEEIKAPGDQLRKNQLISIRALQQAGFNVGIQRVKWWVDPQQTYVVVDIETTGGKADQHRITEIGMVKVQNGKEIDRWQSLVNPQRHIPKLITGLTGITNQMVADAPLFSDVAQEISDFCEGAIFVAHNVNFDYGFIKQEFARLDRKFKMPKLCTVREMKKAYPGLPSYSLANLTEHFGIDMARHHRALSDALAASELLHLINARRMSAL